MKFIEQLRQQAEAKQAAAAENERLHEERVRVDHAERTYRHENALKFADESGVIKAAIELAGALRGDNYEWESEWISGLGRYRDLGARDDCGVEVRWDQQEYEKGEHRYKSCNELTVSVNCAGTVSIDAGWRGSSTIQLAVWKTNKSVLERALEKAYKRPRRRSYEIKHTGDAASGHY